MKRANLSERRNLLSEAKQALLKKRIAAARRPVPTVQAIPKRPDSTDAPLSYAQERYWFLSQLEPDNPANNRPFAYRFHGYLDIPVLEKSLSDIFRRHEILRGTFQDREGKPVQTFLPSQSLPLPILDISGLPPAGRMSEVTQRLMSESKKPFDLVVGPLFRTILFRLDEEDHILLTVFHHMLFDAWSCHVFLHEIEALYAAFAQGKPSPLPEPAVQYTDYAHWQRRGLDGGIQNAQLSYWKKALTGASPSISLPTDYPRPSSRTFQGAHRSLTIPLSLSESIKTLSRREGVTLFMTLLAVFNMLLHRYSNQDDIVVGSPVAGRPHPEIQGLIGFFINTLPLRNDLSGNPTFKELLLRIKDVTVDALSHQDIPFEKLVEELNPERDVSRTPLFQVMFNFENVPQPVADIPGITIEEFDFDNGTASFDLGMEIVEKPEGLVCTIEFNTTIFEAATAERMLGHYEMLLKGICENPSRHLSDLPILTDAEHHQLLVTWNDRMIDADETVCIHQLFEAQAARCPNSVALTFGSRHLTYRDLNNRANRLARHLVELGVVPDSLVAIGVERSIEMVVGILAILKAGGAYLPLDPAYPADRLAYMLKDASPMALLTQSWLKDRWGDLSEGLPVIELDRDDQRWGRYSPADLNPDDLGIRSNHLAYVIYTSGSTGAPKGVMVEHGNVSRLFSATKPWFRFDANDVWTLFHSFAFDFSVWEIWGALLHGGRLVIVPQIVSCSPEEFYQLLCSEKVTILNQTPSAFRQLINIQTGNMKAHALRKIIFGGEALEVRYLKPWYERNGTQQTQLVNMYGITETTVHVTYRALIPADTEHLGASLIGSRIPDLRIYILDAYRQPVPVGVTGELYIGGRGVARGYLNRPELTAERFQPDPFSRIVEPNARMYKTGDLGKWLPDDTIEFLGRNDFQVKIRGFRIELGEIEERLTAIPGVGEAVVLAREDSPDDKRLVAYYTLSTSADTFTAEFLRSYLSSRLPEYMLPSSYVAMERFPLTLNGKTDRKALPAPGADTYAIQAYEAPVGEMEKALARIWSELLGVEQIGRRDGFFNLGGHSLQAVRMIEQLRRKGLDTDVQALFSKPTLMDLAASIGNIKAPVEVPPNLILPDCDYIAPELLPLIALGQGDIDRIVESTPGGAANIKDIYPLAPLQEGIFFHHLMNSKGDVYLLPSILAFDSRELLDSYLAAVQAVINRHDILRTAILWEGLPEPVQVVWRKAQMTVEQVRIDAFAGDAVEQLKHRFDRSRTRIDICKAPMMYAFIAHDDAKGRWLIAMLHHHLVEDHTSMEIFHEEVRAYLSGTASLLPPALPFRNLVAQAWLGVSREAHEAFFRKMLEGVESPTAPFGLTDVRGDGSDITEASLQLDIQLSRRLQERVRILGVSAASVFHLAWARVLACLSSRDDVVFGTVLFGRMKGGLGADRVMGMFINTLPMRIDIKDKPVCEAIKKTHRILAELLHHEHAPLFLAQRCSDIPASMPLFASLINYRHTQLPLPGEKAVAALKGMKVVHEDERTNYPLVLSVDDLGEGFTLTVEVQKPFEPMRIGRFINTAINRLVEALEQTPDIAVRSIEVLPQDELQQMLFDWNDTEVDYPKDWCVHQLFETQVEKTPNAVALVYENEQLTYAELNKRSNRLAHHLISLGVKPDSLVAIGVERSIEMVVGLLAVLKAGGAYVPLDPAHPLERLSFMIEDAQVEMLLTQKKLQDRFPRFTGPVVILDGKQEHIEQQSSGNLNHAGSGDQLAYVMYTSGSTDRPKGVAVVHRGIVRLVKEADYVNLSPDEVFLQFAPISFDASTFEIWGALLNGARLVIFPSYLPSLQELGKVLKRYGVTTLWLTAGLFHQMVMDHLEGLKPVRQLLAGGDVLSAPLVKKALGVLKGCRVINGYGPTENTTFTCCHVMTDPQQVGDSVSIGRPIANTQVYILDDYLQPVPIGIVGELYIGGDGLARGYLNRPELTREKFIANPFSTASDSRLYKSGDLVRYRADGTIEFLWRKDTQVKIRGFRIELGEIEARLSAMQGIGEVTVLAREESPGDKRLVAYYTVRNTAEALTAEQLRSYLSDRLPEYMLPSSYVALERFPLTPNGKVNRNALPAPGPTRLKNAHTAPRTPVEEALSKIWSEVLKADSFDIHDNFFDLGGHSLLATRVISKLQNRFEIELPLRSIFEAPTIAGLSMYVADGLEKRTGPEEILNIIGELDDISDEEAEKLVAAGINRLNTEKGR